jgi:hypothetical protein
MARGNTTATLSGRAGHYPLLLDMSSFPHDELERGDSRAYQDVELPTDGSGSNVGSWSLLAHHCPDETRRDWTNLLRIVILPIDVSKATVVAHTCGSGLERYW